MKKAIILFACIGILFWSVAQETPSGNDSPVLTKQQYLQKSKGQRTAAIIVISAGGVMTIAGLILVVQNLGTDIGNDIFPDTPPDKKKNEALSWVLTVVGAGAMLGSISLFRSAHKNKRIAMSMSFKNEPAFQLQRSMVFTRYVPSLTLKINL